MGGLITRAADKEVRSQCGTDAEIKKRGRLRANREAFDGRDRPGRLPSKEGLERVCQRRLAEKKFDSGDRTRASGARWEKGDEDIRHHRTAWGRSVVKKGRDSKVTCRTRRRKRAATARKTSGEKNHRVRHRRKN